MAAKKKTTEETPEQRTATGAMDTEQAEQTASAPEEEIHGEQTAAEAAEVPETPADPEKDVEDAASDDTGPKLESLSALADRHRVAGWQQAALLRLMGWEDDKRVSDAEYRAALETLKSRRIGGGRR